MLTMDETAAKIAEFLLQIRAIKLNPNDPFTWASGWKSPIYCDNRVTLSYPKVRTFIRQQFTERIVETYGTPEVIAGVATGGIAIGALVAQELGVPFIYVRSKPKGHGLGNMIEGELKEGQDVVVVEDLISTGNSSLTAVKALREAGANVKGMVAIFTYGFQNSYENFEQANCKLETLCNYDKLLLQAVESGYVSSGDADRLKKWKENPSEWQP